MTRNKKRILSVLCAAALTVSLAGGLPEGLAKDTGALIEASAEPSVVCSNTYDGCTYTFYDDGVLEVSSADGSLASIPEHFILETELSKSERDKIKTIEIGDNISSIGDYAFYYLENVTSVNIGKNVTGIGEDAFNSCYALTTVTFADNSILSTIGEGSFGSCNAINNVVLPSSVTEIKKYAFSGDDDLTSITLNEGLKTIRSYAFSSAGLTEITIPSTVTLIEDDAFYYSSAITDVYCNFDPVNLVWEEGWLDDFKPDKKTELHCPVDCYDDFMKKFDGKLNVTTVGDLPSLSGLERVAEVPATCVSDGTVKYYVDPETGTKYSDRKKTTVLSDEDLVIPKDPENGHSWSGWYIKTPATKTSYGTEECCCEHCGETRTTSCYYSDPYYVVTIPATVSVGQTASMSIEYWGDLNPYYGTVDGNGDAAGNVPSFNGYSVYVYLDEINGRPVTKSNSKLMLENSDDHQADLLECNVTAYNYNYVESTDPETESIVYVLSKGEPHSLSDSSALMRGYLDVCSLFLREDSAELEFTLDSDELKNAKPGNYAGSLTFRIELVQEGAGAGIINYGSTDPIPFYLHQIP